MDAVQEHPEVEGNRYYKKAQNLMQMKNLHHDG